MKFKFLIFAAVLLVILAIKSFWWDPSSKRSEIENAYLSKNYSLFLKELKRNENLYSFAKSDLLFAYGYAAQGKYQKAENALKSALEQSDLTPKLKLEVVLNQSLNAYLQNNTKALGLYQNQIDTETLNGREWKKLFEGIYALKEHNCSQALSTFTSHLKLDSLSPFMHQLFSEKLPPAWTTIQIAQCEIGMGKFQQARNRITELERIYTSQESSLAHIVMAKSYLLEGDKKDNAIALPLYENAILELNEASPTTPEYDEIKHLLVDSLQGRLQTGLLHGNIDEILFFESALSQYQSHEEPKPVVAAKKPQEPAPVESLDEWAYENPLDLNYALIQRRIDSILDGEKEISSTEKQLNEDVEFLNLLTQINPPLPPVFYLLGQVELLLQKDQQAVQAFKKYVSLDPDNIWGWKLLGIAQMGINDYAAAINTFLEVTKINPVDLAAWKSLGKIYVEQGDKELAIRAYEKARIMSPFDPEIIASLNQLYRD